MSEPPAIHRSLFPAAVRRSDLLTILKELARHVRAEGYWPMRKEVAKHLKADHAATVDCMNELERAGHVERLPYKSGMARYRLTSKGWGVLGLQPIEPWRKVPSKALIRRTINAAAARALRLESAARKDES